jgi:hypothetical protein
MAMMQVSVNHLTADEHSILDLHYHHPGDAEGLTTASTYRHPRNALPPARRAAHKCRAISSLSRVPPVVLNPLSRNIVNPVPCGSTETAKASMSTRINCGSGLIRTGSRVENTCSQRYKASTTRGQNCPGEHGFSDCRVRCPQ